METMHARRLMRRPLAPWYTRLVLAVLLLAGAAAFATPESKVTVPGAFEVRTGSLKTYLGGIPIPGSSSSDVYRAPTAGELDRWREVLQLVLEERYVAAGQLATTVGYRLIYFRDTVEGGRHIVLREDTADPGWHGVYAFRLNPTRNLVAQSPHPIFDGTRTMGIDFYVETGALAFMQSGTHRNNSPIDSPCSGTLGGNPYRISDMAHWTPTFFQAAHEALHLGRPGCICVNIHGMAATTHSSDVIVSNGTPYSNPSLENSISRQLANYMNAQLQAAGDPRFAVSHQEPNSPSYPLSGSTNTQGRFTNGSPNPCLLGVTSNPGIERFIHLEQSPAVRSGSRENWQFVTDAFVAVIDEFPEYLPSTAPPRELIAAWPLSGTPAESIAGRDATLSPTTTEVPGRHGNEATASGFDGSTSYVLLPSFDYSGDHEEFTLSLWFESSPNPASSFQYIASQGAVGLANEVNLPQSFHLYLGGDTGDLRVRLTNSTGEHWLYNGPGGFLDGAWHHLVLTYSFEDGAAIYANGALLAENTALAGGRFNPEGFLALGTRSDFSGGRFFGTPEGSGAIQDVRLHNRALTAAEVAILFEEEPTPEPTPEPVPLTGNGWMLQ